MAPTDDVDRFYPHCPCASTEKLGSRPDEAKVRGSIPLFQRRLGSDTPVRERL